MVRLDWIGLGWWENRQTDTNIYRETHRETKKKKVRRKISR